MVRPLRKDLIKNYLQTGMNKMIRLSLKSLTLIALVFGISSQAAKADVDLTDGIRAFICDGKSVVLFETDAGWVIPIDPKAEVKRTGNGWRYEDTLNGEVWYLREESRNSWVIDGLSEDGHFTVDCIDLANSVSQVVNIIKPRLDQGIMDTEALLAETKDELQIMKDELSRIQTLTSASQLLASQRVERLCVWMKTYRHLDVLDKSFPLNGVQYKLCN
jgi:hypothetical protein